MNKLSIYVIKEVLKGSLITLLLLLTLFNLFTLSDELKDLGKGEYQLKEIFLYLALTSPRVCYELIPSAALIGSLFVLGGMANNSEIIAMRSIGLSTFWIIRSTMLAGLVLVVFAIFMGEFITPNTEQAAQLLKATTQNNKVIIHNRYGMWLREGNTFVNVRQIQKNSDLADITLYTLDAEQHIQQISHIEHAQFLGKQWRLNTLKNTQFLADSTVASSVDTRLWTTSINPDLLKIVVVDPNDLSLYDLNNYIQFLHANQQKAQRFEAAFWKRLFNPIMVLIMLLVATPFVIGIKRNINASSRVLIGCIFGMSFNVFDQIMGHIGLIYQFNPIVIALLPSVIVFILASYAIFKVKA